MTVAHDYASESHTGTTGSASQASFSWTHSGAASGVKGAVVFTFVNTSTDYATSVTYGGQTMTAVPGGTAADTATEPGRCTAWFVGSGLAQGNQTVQVNRTNNVSVMYAVCATVTATMDTCVCGTPVALNDNQALSEQSVDSGLRYAQRYAATWSGLATPPGVGANTTSGHQIDFTAYGCAFGRETTPGAGSRPVGFSASTDDVAAVHLAVGEKDVDGTVTDKMFMKDLIGQRERANMRADKLFVKEPPRLTTHDLNYFNEKMLLGDAGVALLGEITATRDALDKMFLRDAGIRTYEKEAAVDKMFLRDYPMRELEHRLQAELLFVNDASAIDAGRLRSAADGMFLRDVVMRGVDRLVSADNLLLRDYAVRELELRPTLERLLVKDTTTIEFGVIRSALDTLFVFDAVRRELDKQAPGDKILLGDATFAETAARVRDAIDRLLLRDDGMKTLEHAAATERLLLGDTAQALKAAEQIVAAIDKLFVKESGLSVQHDLVYLPEKLLVGDLVQAALGAVLHQRASIDNLLLRSEVSRDRVLTQFDKVLLNTAKSLERSAQQYDALLLGDVRSRVIERLLREQVFIADRLSELARDVVQRSSLLTGDRATREREMRIVESLLCGDLATVLVESGGRVVDALDKLFLYDRLTMEREVAARDYVLVADAFLRSAITLRDALDKMLLADTSARLVEAGGITRSAVDKLLVATRLLSAKHDLRYLPDKTFIKDTALTEITTGAAALRTALDKLLLGDTSLVESTGALVVLRTALDKLFIKDRPLSVDHDLLADLDSLYVSDRRVSDVAHRFMQNVLMKDTTALLHISEKRVIDALLLADAVTALKTGALTRSASDALLLYDTADVTKTGEIIRYALDALLLYDTYRQGPWMLTARDGLLLQDSRFADLARALLSSLLVVDQRVSSLERTQTDRPLIGDAAALALLQGLVRTTQDPVLLRDTVMRLVEQRRGDFTLLNDAAALGKDIAREVADKMFTLDVRAQSERHITLMEMLALKELASLAREALSREGLYVPDSAAAQWYPVIIEFIEYARLATVQILGITIRTVDPLGRRTASVDPLGRKLGIREWRVH